jgi:hypothetical protein
MASDRRSAANRRNGRLSTGPRTPEGKARSSQNAVTHGLTAQHALLPNEDVSEFERFRFDVHRELDPRGAVEIRLVETAASLMWRLRRVPAFEAALFARTAAIREIAIKREAAEVLSRDSETDCADRRRSFALGSIVDALLRNDTLSNLDRHESSLLKKLMLTLKELRELKKNSAKIRVLENKSK